MSCRAFLPFVVFMLLPVAIARSQQAFLDPIFSVQTTYGVDYGTAPAGYAIPGLGIYPTSGPYQESLTADIYRPEGSNLPSQLPAIILMHEGGFATGDKSDSDIVSVATELAKTGYVVMNINYRLITDGIPDEISTLTSGFDPVAVYENQPYQDVRAEGFAAAINDSKLATQWLLSNASSLNIDTDKLLIGGISAGARVALADGLLEMPHQFAGVMSLLGALDNNESLITPSTSSPVVFSLFMYNSLEDTQIDPVAAQNLVDATSAAGIPTYFQTVDSGHDISLLMQPDENGVSPWSNGISFLYNELSLGDLAANSSSVPEASTFSMVLILGVGFMGRFAIQRIRRTLAAPDRATV